MTRSTIAHASRVVALRMNGSVGCAIDSEPIPPVPGPSSPSKR